MRKGINGFTLVELLIAISVVSVITVIGMVSFQGGQEKVRDSVRKSDLQKIAIALEIYYQKSGRYMISSGSCLDNTSQSSFEEDLASYLTPNFPKDPKTNNPYCYESNDTGSKYTLYAKLDDGTDYTLTSEEYLLGQAAQTDDEVETPIPTDDATAGPAGGASRPTPTTHLPPDDTVAPPGEDDCTWQSNNFIHVYVFNDPDYNPSLWPKMCGGGSADYCAYPNRSPGHPLYNFRDRIEEQTIQNEERPQDGYNGPITIRLSSNLCAIDLVAYRTAYTTYGLNNSSFWGRVIFNVPGLVGRQSDRVTALLYNVWAEIPAGKNFTRGTCHIGYGEHTNLVQVRSGGLSIECGTKFRLGGPSVGGVATFGLR